MLRLYAVLLLGFSLAHGQSLEDLGLAGFNSEPEPVLEPPVPDNWVSPYNATCGFPTQQYVEQLSDEQLKKTCEQKLDGHEALLLCCLIERFQDTRIRYRPVMNYSQTVLIKPTFQVYDIFPLDDIRQTMPVRAKLLLQWTNKLLAWEHLSTYRMYNESKELTLNHTKVGFWTPNVLHINNAGNVHAANDITRKTEVISDEKGAVRLILIGVFETRCPLKLTLWPFDTQSCEFDFQLSSKSSLVQFKLSVTYDLGIKPQSSSLWEFLAEKSEVTENSVGDTVFRYTMTVKRKDLYYLVTVIGPAVLSAMLQLSTFWIPFYRGARSNYSVVITLNFVVLQLAVKSLIPKSTQTVYLVMYLLALFGLGAISTLHSVLLYFSYDSGAGEYDPKLVIERAREKKRINPFVVDGIVFGLVTIATLGAHFLLFGVAMLQIVKI